MTKNRRSTAQETEQAILKVQRALCLMNAPHSYRLFSVTDLVQSAITQSGSGDTGDGETALGLLKGRTTPGESSPSTVPAANDD